MTATALRHVGLSAGILLIVSFVIIGCAREVTRDDWQRMSRNEKTLYVNSLLGAETARARKRGDGRVIRATPDEIIAQIDSAYAAGDQRPVEAVFSTLADRPDSPQQPRQPQPASP